MLFNSLSYAVFLPIVFVLYWILPGKFRWAGLLAVSWWFVFNLNPGYLLALILTTVLSFLVGLALAGTEHKKRVLVIGLIALVGELAFFKYTNFLIENINTLILSRLGGSELSSVSIILPIGISFYIFETIGYLADVYRGKIEPEKHFGYYALFVSFFPSLVSGPIGRADKLLPQYRGMRDLPFKTVYVSRGLKMIAWGYFMKLCIADALTPYVDKVYANPDIYVGLIGLVVPILYSFEIYCDFAGYSLIAIGSASLLGIGLPENFRSPYCAKSVREFWGRWHMSLSTWLRDYLYIPLGGSRCSELRHAFNLMVTFLVSGLWHGASWTFVLWGGIHGAYQVVESLVRHGAKGKKNPFPAFIRVGFTFLLVTFAWMFFKADKVSTVFTLLKNIPVGMDDPVNYLKVFVMSIGATYADMVYMLILFVILFVGDFLGRNRDLTDYTASLRPAVKYPLYILFLVVLALASQKGVTTGFIYSAF